MSQSSLGKNRFIDFDTGLVSLAPDVQISSIQKPWSLDQKIDLFECRVSVWQLGVAAEILKNIESPSPHNVEEPALSSIWCHAAYGLVAVTFSYFEMIGKILNSNSAKRGTSPEDFNHGFCDVYTHRKPTNNNYKDFLGRDSINKKIPNREVAIVIAFRDRIRNGMYHLGYTKKGVRLHNDEDILEDFITSEEVPAIAERAAYNMNPHRATKTIIKHFPTFVERLRDKNNKVMRIKFEQFFDEFHAP